MKTVTLSIKEFYLFKSICNFFFDVTIKKNIVEIQADAMMLESLGY